MLQTRSGRNWEPRESVAASTWGRGGETPARCVTLGKSLPLSGSWRPLLSEKRLKSEPVWLGRRVQPLSWPATSPQNSRGGTRGGPRPSAGSRSAPGSPVPGRQRPAAPACPRRRSPGGRAEGGGASRGGGEEGAEASADGGGLLVHYKITKNTWKTITGFKSK